MNIFRNKSNNDKETISIYKKECKRLEKERNELLAKLDSIEEYKQQYEDLIAEAMQLKNRYEVLISKTETIGNAYKEKLEYITKTDY